MRNIVAKTVAASVLAAIAGMAASANAGETIDFVSLNGGPVNSGGTADNGGTGSRGIETIIFNYTFTNSFLWNGGITTFGTLQNGGSGTYASEARVRVVLPGSNSSNSPDVQAFTTSSYGASISTPGSGVNQTLTFGTSLGGGINMLGQTVQFRFYESYDDPGVDQTWSDLRIQFNDYVPPTPPSNAFDLGNISGVGSDGHTLQSKINIPQGQTTPAWYTFTWGGGSPVDFFTYGSTVGASTQNGDTVMGLFDSTGNLIAQNDDFLYPPGWSHLGFGNGSGADADGPGPAGAFVSGSPGTSASSLAAGTYYLGVIGYNGSGTPFSAGWNCLPSNGVGGSVLLNIIPTPSTMALLGLGGLVATRRRRA